MIELLIFLSVQLIINFIIRLVANKRVSYVFISLAKLIFGILIIVYPIWSWRIYDFFYPPDPNGIHCGNMQVGAIMFQWIVGIPIVILLQWVLNKYLHKSNKLLSTYEKK